MEVIEMERKYYQDYEFIFEYETEEHYSAEVVKTKVDFSFKAEAAYCT